MNDYTRFGVFLAPHHPIGENLTLQLQRDLQLATLLDELGYDEGPKKYTLPATRWTY